MNKSHKAHYPIEYDPYDLDPSFPILGIPAYRLDNREITVLHIHECLELAECVEGRGVFVFENSVVSFRPGDFFIIPRQEPHYLVHNMSRYRSSIWNFVFFDPLKLITLFPEHSDAAQNPAFWSPPSTVMFSERNQPLMAETVRILIRELNQRPPFFRDIIQARAFELLIRALRIKNSVPSAAHHDFMNKTGRIVPALEHISTNYSCQIDSEDLARICAMSLRNFNRIFKSALGKSPQEYICTLRIAKTLAELKASSKSISQIAYQVGFQTISSFNRTFKDMLGVSPRKWRTTQTRRAGDTPLPSPPAHPAEPKRADRTG